MTLNDGRVVEIKNPLPVKADCFYYNDRYPNQLIYIAEFLVDGLYVNVYKFVFKDSDSIGNCDKLLLIEHTITDDTSLIRTESAMGEFFPDENIRSILRAVRGGDRLDNTNLEANSWFEKAFENSKRRRIAVEKSDVYIRKEETEASIVTAIILDMNHSLAESWYMFCKHRLCNYSCQYLFNQLLSSFRNDRAVAVYFAKQDGLWDDTICDPCQAIVELPGSTDIAIRYAKQRGWWQTPIPKVVYLKEDVEPTTQPYDHPHTIASEYTGTFVSSWHNIAAAEKEAERDKISIADAWQCLSEAMSCDFDWAWSVHCNLAMPIMDGTGCSHEKANITAAQLMRHLFRYDVTGLKRYHDALNRNSLESNSPGVESNAFKSVNTPTSLPSTSSCPCVEKEADVEKPKAIADYFVVDSYYSNPNYPNWLLLVTPASLTLDNVVSFECIEVPNMNKLDNLVFTNDQIDITKFSRVFPTSTASCDVNDLSKDPFVTAINDLCGNHRDTVANFKPCHYYHWKKLPGELLTIDLNNNNPLWVVFDRIDINGVKSLQPISISEIDLNDFSLAFVDKSSDHCVLREYLSNNMRRVSPPRALPDLNATFPTELNSNIWDDSPDIHKNNIIEMLHFFKPGVVYYNKNTGKFYRFCIARHNEYFSFVFNLTTPNLIGLPEVVNIAAEDIDLDDWSEADRDSNVDIQSTTVSYSRSDYQKLQKIQAFFKTDNVYKHKDDVDHFYIYREHCHTENTVILTFNLIKVFSDNFTIITGKVVYLDFNMIDLNKWEEC